MIPVSIPATLVVSSLMFGAPQGATDPDVSALLARAAQACRALRSAAYHARIESAGPYGYVREGDVRLVKWESAKNEKSTLHADIRMNLSDGGIYAYDGNRNAIVVPDQKKVIVVTAEQEGERWITGNVVGGLVETPLVEQEPFHELLAAPSLTYAGIASVGGVECHVLRSESPGNEVFRDVRTTWHLAVGDLLPRRRETSGTYSDKRTTTTLLITNLAVNVPIEPSTFEIVTPKGFVVENYIAPPKVELLALGSRAPAFRLSDPVGDEHALSELEGTIVILDFWGTWCGPCIMAMPSIQRLHERFGEQGVRIFGVSCREPEGADPATLMEARGFTYGLLLDGDPVAALYQVTAYPTFYVIGRDGTIVHRHAGYSEALESELSGVIEKELKKER